MTHQRRLNVYFKQRNGGEMTNRQFRRYCKKYDRSVKLGTFQG